ncbi:MAG: nitroreductase family deazaflavin-dependent oxidoreductase [Solirubrobacteraceae bacterium]
MKEFHRRQSRVVGDDKPAPLRAGLLVLSIYQALVGIWALFFPRGFYDDFPLGHPLVGLLPPFNEHLVRDVGGFSLGFAFIFAASTVVMQYNVIRVAIIGYEFVAVPHFIFHACHLHGFPMVDAIIQTVGLALIAALPLALLGLTLGRNPSEAPMPARSFENANVFHRAVRMFATTKVSRVLFGRTAHHLDRIVSRLTDGKHTFAGIVGGLPVVILTTTGAKSGAPLVVALLGVPHPDGVAVVASNYGSHKHPAWYHNLKANPAATIKLDGETWRGTARQAMASERDELWAKAVAIFPGAEKYEVRAGDRHIEAFILARN